MNSSLQEADTRPPAWQRLIVGRSLRTTLIRAGVLAAACLVVFGFGLKPVRVDGISMEPAYRHGSVNFLNRLSYAFNEPRRGDVVCIKTTGMRHMYMKRVVGLPGERIAIRNGLVFINGRPLDEPYVVERANWNWPEMQLGPDSFFTIGDNRGMDQQLHTGGEIPREKIAGKVLR